MKEHRDRKRGWAVTSERHHGSLGPQHAVTLCIQKDVVVTGMSSRRHLVAVLGFMTSLALVQVIFSFSQFGFEPVHTEVPFQTNPI